MLLLRVFKDKDNTYTLGVLFTDSGIYYTMEPPWRDNKRNVSCIPNGTYDFEFLDKSYSGKYRNCLHIKGVPGRTGILMHSGNLVGHTKGCILPGKRLGTMWGERAVLSSKSALAEITSNERSGRITVM